MTEKQQGFEFVDKRRVRADADTPKTTADDEARKEAAGPTQSEPAQTATGESEAAQGTDQAGAGPEERAPNVDVYGLLASFFGMLSGLAWQKMGVVANPATGQIETDLPQAKIAIDTMQFMLERIEPKVPPAEMRELRRVMMDLQMNFVRRSTTSG